ncbi:TetR/AcrR family transcriptional regulator [Streptomyces sp. NPDC002896]|uniref:TetR/AcrR family transcriptional regulator n=1 Tax=Streptomyces sp. NPDC002896 TaxID=3154438 RepID=UPI00332434BF
MVSATPVGTDSSTNVPRSRRGAETKARLVEAAKAVFEEKGFHDARVSDIAERAGMSHGSFYHYFDSKEDVFREVAAAIDSALSAGMDIILDPSSTATPKERLTAAIRVHFEAYRKEARIMSVIEQVSHHDEQIHALWTHLYQQHGKEVADSIERLQRHGLADPALDPAIAAAAVAAMTWRFGEQWLVQGHPQCDFETGVEQITRLVVNALQL